MTGAIVALVAAVVIFGLPIGMAFALRDAPANGSTRRAHYTGRRRDGSIGQITASRETDWE